MFIVLYLLRRVYGVNVVVGAVLNTALMKTKNKKCYSAPRVITISCEYVP
jgi:hypothetical protein